MISNHIIFKLILGAAVAVVVGVMSLIVKSGVKVKTWWGVAGLIISIALFIAMSEFNLFTSYSSILTPISSILGLFSTSIIFAARRVNN